MHNYAYRKPKSNAQVKDMKTWHGNVAYEKDLNMSNVSWLQRKCIQFQYASTLLQFPDHGK